MGMKIGGMVVIRVMEGTYAWFPCMWMRGCRVRKGGGGFMGFVGYRICAWSFHACGNDENGRVGDERHEEMG